QLQAFTDCSGYTTRYEYDRYGQQIAVHREEGISTYSSYNPCGQLVSQRDAQGRETRYEYSAAGDLTATVSPDGKRSTIEYDKRGRPVSVTEGGLTRSMGYDAAGRITVLTNENGSQSTFRYDPVDRLTEQRGFDGRTQRYQYDLTGKLTQSEDEGLITLWHYDASDRITRRTVNGEPAEQWQYDDHGWLTEISHLSEGHRVAVHYGYDDKGRLTGERQTVENPETGEMLWEHETGHAYSEQGLATRQEPDGLPPVEWLTYGSGYLAGMKLGETSAQHLQQSLRLPGQQYDEESGLYYNRNRYYDPLQGRYITQDPIGLRGEWNLYKYPLNPVRFIDSLGLKFHVNGDPSDFNQAVEYLKQDSQMKETIDFLSSSEETINIEYIEGTNVRFNSNNMTIYWNSRASLFCSTELNSKSQSPALGLGHEFAHAQYYLLDKENFMALLSRTDKKYENKEEARVITIIELRAAKTLGECTRGAHSGLPFYRVDGPLQTMKITGTPE
ncbi:RHS repeat protein, partial [Escherichia coli]|nr:RHS repeat protein [Escherichia coli]